MRLLFLTLFIYLYVYLFVYLFIQPAQRNGTNKIRVVIFVCVFLSIYCLFAVVYCFETARAEITRALVETSFKAPAKRSQHANTTCRNMVGRNMLRAFGHRVAMCCDMLGVVGSSLTSFKLEPTTPNMLQHVATG